jgi:hypothetical protein
VYTHYIEPRKQDVDRAFFAKLNIGTHSRELRSPGAGGSWCSHPYVTGGTTSYLQFANVRKSMLSLSLSVAARGVAHLRLLTQGKLKGCQGFCATAYTQDNGKTKQLVMC